MSFTPGRDSTFGSILADLLVDFTSDFLFVTGAFDCTDTGVTFFDAGFAFVFAAEAAFLAIVVDGLFTFAGASLLAAGALAATFFATGFFAATVAVFVAFTAFVTAFAATLVAVFFAASA
jgi:hypothetical protein